jgi:hypothetical protein
MCCFVFSNERQQFCRYIAPEEVVQRTCCIEKMQKNTINALLVQIVLLLPEAKPFIPSFILVTTTASIDVLLKTLMFHYFSNGKRHCPLHLLLQLVFY